MYTALLTLKNKFKVCPILIIFFFVITNNLNSATIQIPTAQGSGNQSGTATTGKRSEKVDKEDLPKKLPRFTIGPIGSINYFNISPHSENKYPEWDGTQFSLGGFFDLRMSNYFGLKFSYEYQFPVNMLSSMEFAKAYHVMNLLVRYVLAIKHQLWIGLGMSMHIGDSFTTYQENLYAFNAGLISNAYSETEPRVIYFFNLYMGYYLKVSELIVLDFTVSYGLIHSRHDKWRYNSFRIHIGVGFQL